MGKMGKRFTALALAVILLFSGSSVALGASNSGAGQAPTAQATAQASGSSPLKVEISANKGKITLIGKTKFTATVTNISNSTVNNISAEALFGKDLRPLQGGQITATKISLVPGESFQLHYSADLKGLKGLDNLLLPFFWISSWIHGSGFIIPNNGFNDGRAYIEASKSVGVISLFSKSYDVSTKAKVYYGGNEEVPNSVIYREFHESVKNIEQKYIDENGFVSSQDIRNLMSEVEHFIITQDDIGKVNEWHKNGETSYGVTLSNGIFYVYIVPTEGIDLVENRPVVTSQPFDTDYPAHIQEISVCVDESARKIASLRDSNNEYRYSFVADWNDAEVSLDSLKTISDYKVVIWHGHGVHDTIYHSLLATGEIPDEVLDSPEYAEDFADNSLGTASNNRVLVTARFFEKHLGQMDNALVYLGTCESGACDVLANAFLSKGTSTVFANSGTIHTDYNLSMIREVMNAMTTARQGGSYATAREALETAKSINGAIDIVNHNGTIINTEVLVFENSIHKDYRFLNKQTGENGTTNWGFIIPITHQTTVPVGYTGIYTPQDLDSVRNNLSGNYIMMNNIDLASWGNWMPIGSGASNNYFSGIFDGNGYAIRNMQIEIEDVTSLEYVGIFGYISQGSINNLALKSGNINITYAPNSVAGKVGGIAGMLLNSGRIDNCFYEGVVFNQSQDSAIIAGGIVGSASGTINNCYSKGSVVSKSESNTKLVRSGGIAGYSNGPISNCYNDCTVLSYSGADSIAGGITGETQGSLLQKCYNSGLVGASSTTDSGYARAGGISGHIGGTIVRNCYNNGTISAISEIRCYTGGITGTIPLASPTASITYCYNTGLINGSSGNSQDYFGGIAGYTGSSITSTYYLDTTAETGVKQDEYLSTQIRSLSDSQMKLQSSYRNFDFDTVWAIDPDTNNGYPYLQGLQS